MLFVFIFSYNHYMNTVYNFPASKLPAELRGDISRDAFVTVVVDDEMDDLFGSISK